MTPNIYSEIAIVVGVKKKLLIVLSVVAVGITVASVVLSKSIEEVIPHQVPFGIGTVLLIITWSLLVIIFWYGPNKDLNPKVISEKVGFSHFAYNAQSWWAAIVLSICLIAGLTVWPLMLWQQTIGG
ncbi:MAG: hypothetical protein KZQ93_01235 [Candidatus Thiodiazotropha sp. (ex Monitilora ramsayi)]|nr:hypothetical protein [Candidatus Thiodiazotropha sp. (ex Monitilora ramsayi)]